MSTKFNLELALKGHPVSTKDGRKVTDFKIIDDDAPKSAKDVREYVDNANHKKYYQGITAVLHNNNNTGVFPFYHDGGSHLYGSETQCDLVMV